LDSDTFALVKELVSSKNILVSSHGYDELAEDDISYFMIDQEETQQYQNLLKLWLLYRKYH